jgi:hypothetical protein
MKSVPRRLNDPRFGMSKFKITLILAVITAGTGLQLPGASAAQSNRPRNLCKISVWLLHWVEAADLC